MKERTSVMVDRADFDLLKEVRDAHGWTTGEATRRAVHALFALDQHLKAIEEQQDGHVRDVLARLRQEIDPALLLRAKDMRRVGAADGTEGIAIDDVSYFVEEGRLFARREVDGRIEVSESVDGRLVARWAKAPDEVALT